MTEVLERFFSFSEAAEFLRVRERWLRDNSKDLPRHKFGKTVSFSESDLAEISSKYLVRPETTPPPVNRPTGGGRRRR